MTCGATDADMLAAVERWARARRIFRAKHQVAFSYQEPRPACPWLVRFRRASVEIFHWDFATPFAADPHTALLWALLVETTETLTSPPLKSEAEARAWAAARVMSGRMEILRPSGVSARRPGEPLEFGARVTRSIAVDLGRCPTCEARSLPGRKLATVEWGMAICSGRSKPYIAHPKYLDWERGWGGRRRKGTRWWAQHWSRPCPDCNGTGRDLREAARLVLDAAPRLIDPDVRRIFFGDNPPPTVRLGGCGEEVSTTHEPGDQQARDALTVEADRMLPDLEGKRPHDPAREQLGEWLALWLAGKRDETADAVDRLDVIAAVRGGSYSFLDGEVIEAPLV